MGRVPQGTRSPYGHSRNAALRQEDSPVGRAERVPPTGTRKSALRRWRKAVFFLMPALVQARRRVWESGGTRPAGDAFPLRALAKAAVLRTCSLSFARTSLRLRRRMRAQMKNSPSRGCFCSLVPVVGLEPTRILLHRILSPARLPISPHRRTCNYTTPRNSYQALCIIPLRHCLYEH